MKVLHLVGSTLNEFYFNLSYVYFQNVVHPAGFSYAALLRMPTGEWQIEENGGSRRPIDFADIQPIASGYDIVVPHMFCPQGMTSYRSYFEDIIGIPVVGPSARATTLALSKWDTKALARAVGVNCPEGVRVSDLSNGATPALPCIAKPDTEDNSIGVSLVKAEQDYAKALEHALSFAPVAVVEDYIPGREIRIGVVELESGPRALPAIEYHVTEDRPIRTLRDKLDVSDDGSIAETRWTQPTIPSSCPADVDADLYEKMCDAALKLHEALSCRDYSLYDFRVDANGEIYLLEPCLFWSFSSRSIISMMIEADDTLDLHEIISTIWKRTAERRVRAFEPKHTFLAAS